MRVAVLGLGAMGSRMAAALLRAEHAVTVWNRSAAKAEPLAEQGALVSPTPRAAVEGAELVIAMVRDETASKRVWLDPADGALPAMSGDAVGIESSTLTVPWIQQLAAAFAAKGVPFLEAPVVGTRAQADASTLIHLIGGDPEYVARALPALAAIGNARHHLGPTGSATALKLVVNALLTIQVAAVGELLGASERLGLDRGRAAEVLVEMPSCSASAKGVIMAMLARNFAPAFPVELVQKDLGYLLDSVGSEMAPMSAAAKTVFGRAAANGHAADNMSAVATLYERR